MGAIEGEVGMRSQLAAIGALAALALAGCSSLPVGQPNGPRALDYLNDDVAAALIAFDLPPSLEPVPGGSVLSIGFTGSTGAPRVRAVLQRADATDLAGTLPPPDSGRAYYLFGFSPADQQAIRAAQAFARTLSPGAAGLEVRLSPALCSIGPVRPEAMRVSVRVALPAAPALAPVIADQPLSLVAGPGPLPACAGHSG
jgi:hypothetical protein